MNMHGMKGWIRVLAVALACLVLSWSSCPRCLHVGASGPRQPDDDGNVLGEIASGRRLAWVSLDDVKDVNGQASSGRSGGGSDDVYAMDDEDDNDDNDDNDDVVREGQNEYEYVYDDVYEDVYHGEEAEEEGTVPVSFSVLTESDIREKDVFASRMQEVMARRAKKQQKGKRRRTKVKVSTRYLAPERGSSGRAGSTGALQRSHQSTFLEVTFLTIGMALSAGFGAVPFFFVKKLSPTMNGLATAVACGVMFAASFDLIHEGQPYGPMMVIIGVGVGAVFIKAMQSYLDSLGDVSFGKLHGAKAKRLILIVGIMAAHAIGEGCGVGVSFVGEKGFDQGLLTTLAIGIHNIPEGMAKATVLVSQGATPVEALFWSVMTCLPQPLMAIPSFLFVTWFEFLLPVSLGFAAGCMIWMVFAELLPEALQDCDAGHVASAATFSAAGLEGFRMLMEGLDETYGGGRRGAGTDEVSFDDPDAALEGASRFLPKDIRLSFGLVLGVVSVATSWVPHMARITNATIPVVLGMVSVVMGLIGVLPIGRDLFFDTSDAPRLHVVAAAAIGMVGIVLLRNIILDRGYAMLIKRRERGDGFLGRVNSHGNGDGSGTGKENGTHPTMSAMNVGLNHRLPSRKYASSTASMASMSSNASHPPLRALAVILVVTSILHAMVCGAQLQRVGPEYGDFSSSSSKTHVDAVYLADIGTPVDNHDGKSLSLAAAYGGLFGIVAGCSSFLWELTDSPSILRSSIAATIISGACILAHQAVVIPSMHRLILPYPRGVLDTLSYVAHGALAMTALLTLAVGMTSQPRYTRFGVILAWILLLGWGVSLWAIGTDVVRSVLSL